MTTCVSRWPVAAAVALIPTTVQAKPPPAGRPPQLEPAQIRVVESTDAACTDRCSDWIAIQGSIGPGSAARFAATLHDLGARRLPVLVDSPGGSVPDAIAIGHLIRARHLDVAVSKTAFATCPADRSACDTPSLPGTMKGTPVTFRSICASACSFILAGGDQRYVGSNTFVGVHQFRSYRNILHVLRLFRVMTRMVDGVRTEISRTLVSQKPLFRTTEAADTPQTRYDQAERYFTAMGIAPQLMTLAEQTPPERLHWLSRAELGATRMDTEDKDGVYLIAHAAATPPSTPSDAPGITAFVPSTAAAYAFLTEQGAPAGPRRWTGRVSWSASASGHTPVLTADADFGPGVGRLDVEIAAQDPSPDQQADRISLAFKPATAGPLGVVAAVGQPNIRFEQGSPPITLDGTLRRASPERFEFDPPKSPTAADHEARLILASECIDIPITTAAGHTALLSIQRGESGTMALGSWRSFAARADAKAKAATSP